MDPLFHILTLIALDLILVLGWITIPLGFGGNFILLGAAVAAALLSRFTLVGWPALAVIGGAVAAGEIIETLLGPVFARRYGASKRGIWGAYLGGVIGGIAGTAIFPLIGSLIGSFAGSAIGAAALEIAQPRNGRREIAPGLRAGFGAFLGRVAATSIKMMIGTGIVIYLVLRTH